MEPEQSEFWIATNEIKTPGHPFFKKLNALLATHHFDERVEALCRPHFAASTGRPSIPLARYFRMLMVGYFEGISLERQLSWRCDDFMSLNAFLGLALTDSAPDHSTLSIARHRLPIEVFEAVNKLVLEILKDAGEAAPTRAQQATFDRKREDRTTSNADWTSPTDPEARVTRTKDRRTHLAYKPEHAVDINSGAIVAATMNPADQSDHATSTDTIVRALENLEHVEMPTNDVTIVADKGYHSEAVIAGCAVAELKTCVSERRVRGRHRWADKSDVAQRAMLRNHRRVTSAYGKRLMRRRGETVERSFAHVLETGGMRRTHLRGRENNEKRYLVQVSAFNLGLVMRKICGFGTPRGLAAAVAALMCVLLVGIRLRKTT